MKLSRYLQLVAFLIVQSMFAIAYFMISHASSLIDGIRMEDRQIIAEAFELNENEIGFTIVEVNILN